MTINKYTLQLVIAFTSIYIIWGSTFLAVSVGIKGFPPFILTSFRFIIAGVFLLLWERRSFAKNKSLANWKKNAVTGILILTGGSGLVAWGEQFVSSTEASIAIATGPFWFILFDRKNWNHYFTNKPILIGLVIGFVGLILFLQGSVTSSSHAYDPKLKIFAFAILTLSSIFWVFGSLYSKNNAAELSTIHNTAQQLIAAGLASIVIAALQGEWTSFNLSSVQLNSWIGLWFLIVFGSIVAYLSYIWLLTVKDPVSVSTHAYINPIVAVLVGWIFAAETIGFNQLVGLFVILFGVLLTNISSYKISKRTLVKARKINAAVDKFSTEYSLLFYHNLKRNQRRYRRTA